MSQGKVTVALILAGGRGSRMQSDLPKVLQPCGPQKKTLVEHVLDAVHTSQQFDHIVVLTGYKNLMVEKHLAHIDNQKLTFVHQVEQLGTGHAVQCCAETLDTLCCTDLVVLCGDSPLIQATTLVKLLKQHLSSKVSATVLTGHCEQENKMGRILRDKEHFLEAIVETADCTEHQLTIKEVNSGVYVFRWHDLRSVLDQLKPQNAQKELYLTDTIGLLKSQNKMVGCTCLPAAQFYQILGVNTPQQLCQAEQILQQ